MDTQSLKYIKLTVALNMMTLSFIVMRLLYRMHINVFVSLAVCMIVTTKLSHKVEDHFGRRFGMVYKNINLKILVVLGLLMNILFFGYFLYFKEYAFLISLIVFYAVYGLFMKWWGKINDKKRT